MAWGRQTRTRVRLCGGVFALAVLVTGCWGGGGDADGAREPSAGATPSAYPENSASPGSSEGANLAQPGGSSSSGGRFPGFVDFVPDPDLQPKNRTQALKLARKVIAKPEDWGAGYVKSSDFKSGPRRTSELDEDCVWKQRPLRSSEFVSIVRRSELPATDETGPMRVAAVVTVHRTEMSARWEMARTLEEPLRCLEQQLNATERVTGLRSGGDLSPDQGDDIDSLQEAGEVHSDLPGSPHPYVWDVFRMGTVTLAVSVKGSNGHDEQEVLSTGSTAGGYMAARVKLQLGVRK